MITAIKALSNTRELAQTLMDQKRFNEAVPVWQECVRISRILHGSASNHTVICLERLGRCLTRTGLHHEALDCFVEAHDFFLASAEEEEQSFYMSCKNLGLGLADTGAHEQAVPYLKSAIAGAERFHGDAGGTALLLQSTLTACLVQCQSWSELASLGGRILAVSKPSGRNSDKFILQVMRNTATALQKLEQWENGLTCILQAVDLGRHLYGEGHCSVLDDLRLASRFLWQLQRREDSISTLKEVLAIAQRRHRKSARYAMQVKAELKERRVSTAKQDQHVFDMVLSTQPTDMLLSPEAAACLREKLPVEKRTIFDACLKVRDFDGLKILCLSRGE